MATPPDDAVVTRALIPCGGRGTRMRALSGSAPKELLPVAGESAVSRVARECAASGITDLLVVIAPDKQAIARHLAPLAGGHGMPARITFVEQSAALGLADAIRLGRDFAAGEPLAVALPDNLFLGHAPALAQVIETHQRTHLNVVAVVEVLAEDADRRGPTPVFPGTLDGDTYRIARIPDKAARQTRFDTGGAAWAFTGVGRYVLEPDAFDAIDMVERACAPGAELDDVPVMQRLLAAGRLVGRRVRGRFLDLGLPDGYREADRALASPVDVRTIA